jgi:hypothetical protein
MDLPAIVRELPETSPVRRLIDFCAVELQLTTPERIACVLSRAARVADGVATLEHEGRLVRGEFEAEFLAELAHTIGPMQALVKDVVAFAKKPTR